MTDHDDEMNTMLNTPNGNYKEAIDIKHCEDKDTDQVVDKPTTGRRLRLENVDVNRTSDVRFNINVEQEKKDSELIKLNRQNKHT